MKWLALLLPLALCACPTQEQTCADDDDVAMLSDGHTQLMQQLKTNNENVRRLLCRFRVTPSDGPCDDQGSP